MDYADKKLENGPEQIYDYVRKPFERLHLKLAVTQNGLHPPYILRQLRNKVAHAANYDVNTLLAKQYIEMCYALIEELKLLEASTATSIDKASA